MQTFREEHNEKRIDNLEERLKVLETAVSNEWDSNTMIFKTIQDAFDTIQKITMNLDGRVQRLEQDTKLMLMEANINGYTEGLKDSSKPETVTEFADRCRECGAKYGKLLKQRTGHWIKISPAEIYECSECGQNVMPQDICAYKFCHGCGARMESEEK